MNVNEKVLNGNYLISECNNHFLEIVGRENDSRGRFNFTAFLIAISVSIILAFAIIVISDERVPMGLLVIAALGGLMAILMYVAVYFLFMYDSFKVNQYSVRILKAERKVSVIMRDGSVAILDWDSVSVEYTTSDGKGNPVLFIPGVVWLSSIEEKSGKTQRIPIGSDMLDRKYILENIWNIAKDYMDRPDGVELTKERINFCVPGSSVREGTRYGILHGYAIFDKPLLKVIFSPIATPMVLGRWLSMSTSKIPAWPNEVLEACQLKDDEETLNWKNYNAMSFWENEWVIICFSIGMIVDLIGVYYLILRLTH